MATHTITCIDSTLPYLESRLRHLHHFIDRLIGVLMHKLKGLRTFLLCSIVKLSNNVQWQIENDNANTSTSIGSLLVRIEDVVSNIMDTRHDSTYSGSFENVFQQCLVDVESFEAEIDELYTRLPSSPSATIDQLWCLAHSVIENLDDFLSLHGPYVGVLVEEVESLKEFMTFLRNFIRFATLLCSYHPEFFAQIEYLAIRAARLTVHLFSATHYNTIYFYERKKDLRAKDFCYDGILSMISPLLLKINPASNCLLHDIYTLALASLKCSIKSANVPFVYSADNRLTLMKDFIFLLLSTLWDMLQLETYPLVTFKDQFQHMYKELKNLRTLLEKFPDKFDSRSFHMTRCTVLDAGFLIFSIYQKDFAIDLGFQEFQDNIRGIREKVLEGQLVQTSDTVLGFLDFLLDYLRGVPTHGTNSDTHKCVIIIREDIVFLRSFMGKLEELRTRQGDLCQALWNLALEVAYQIELLIDQLLLGDIQNSFSRSFQSIRKEMLIIKTGSMNIFDDIRQEIGIQEIASTDQVPSQSNSSTTDVVVGFGKEKTSVVNRLMRGSENLQVVSIVGMPGLGKTTLAMQVYNDTWYHFHVRTWCSISQVFDRRKVLLELLNHIQPSDRSAQSVDDLAHELRRSLLGRRYIIFMDDIWDIGAYECLKESFPNDSLGSRILLTSRQCDLVPEAIRDGMPLFLPHLTSKESLELLQKKVFPDERDWPPALQRFGKEVAKYCKGLPLTVVIVAGILTSKRQEDWEDILKSLRSGTISTSDQCLNMIELSYKHLPLHLKPCFLSFGIFQEDEVVSVKRLICLWIAEGFVRISESKSMEEVAGDYLNNLISRCLVMKAKEGSRGGVKACRIHDLLHDFCLRKAKEQDAVFHVWKGQDDLLSFDGLGNMRRLCIHSKAENLMMSKLYCASLRSLFFYRENDWNKKLYMPFIFRIFKSLRVLSMELVGFTHFPSEIQFLVQLRYLAIQVVKLLSPSICKLINLETLIIYPRGGSITLPDTFWNLQKLRYLFLYDFKNLYIFLPKENLGSSHHCLNLDSASWLYFSSLNIMEKQLKRFTNIRRLKCTINIPGNLFIDMSLTFLSQLESLSLSFSQPFRIDSSTTDFIFPESIKKLSLCGCWWSWSKISRIAELPNLEVLKLLKESFVGDSWHVEEGNFPKLKILMLISLDIVKWTASDDSFPNLEKIVLGSCVKLKEIPECWENMLNLKRIEVRQCTEHVESLVRIVEIGQTDMGNSELQVDVRDTYKVAPIFEQ